MIQDATSHRYPRIDNPSHPLYAETVYAGVLGKLIGVYLGRPVENWSHERITQEFGEITYYIHEQTKRDLIITDDDISGTLTFLRALQDYNYDRDITPAQIGQTWLNYLIEETTILWWGGLGNSTEHTAYLRLKQGIQAPQSGSAAFNGQTISEQIGAQIFIDGWGLVCPGNPGQAADFAYRAASVSHDGEAINGARVVAALVAEAFVERDINHLLDTAVSFIPPDSIVRRLIDDIREWHIQDRDWRASLAKLHTNYGYDKYRGQCHLVPNHGVIILSLLHGQGDFDESMKIVNTCGWDTDCNSGNVGAILGVRNGLAGLSKQDWRGPVADRLFLPSTDPGRSITDAAREAIEVINAGRGIQGKSPIHPKEGARFHFDLPGSVQGFRVKDAKFGFVRNIRQSFTDEVSGLLISKNPQSVEPVRVSTPTFIPPEAKDRVTGYVLVACPTIYSGHVVKARLIGQEDGASGHFFLSHYDENDESRVVGEEGFKLAPNETRDIQWTVPDTHGYPIHEIGLELSAGAVVIERMDWANIPSTSWPVVQGTMWSRAWADALDRFRPRRDNYEYLAQNYGTGFLVQGHREWKDYRVSARITPRMAESGGIAVRFQGARRHYAFLFGAPGEIRLEKVLDGTITLAKVSYPWQPFENYEVAVEAVGNKLRLIINGELILQSSDNDNPLESGAFAFVVTAGCLGAGTPSIEPL